jgi:hypothetical protein
MIQLLTRIDSVIALMRQIHVASLLGAFTPHQITSVSRIGCTSHPASVTRIDVTPTYIFL